MYFNYVFYRIKLRLIYYSLILKYIEVYICIYWIFELFLWLIVLFEKSCLENKDIIYKINKKI